MGELGFTYTERPEVLHPTREGGEVRRAGDVVFQMNGPAIAENAPYILAESAAEGLAAMNWANNASSSSIPQLMASRWVELTGRIGLPAVGRARPGK